MRILPVLLLTLGFAACEEQPHEIPPTKAKEGREETKNIRNTENIGYSGNAIGDRVDNALDANEKHAEEMKKAEEAANPQQ